MTHTTINTCNVTNVLTKTNIYVSGNCLLGYLPKLLKLPLNEQYITRKVYYNIFCYTYLYCILFTLLI